MCISFCLVTKCCKRASEGACGAGGSGFVCLCAHRAGCSVRCTRARVVLADKLWAPRGGRSFAHAGLMRPRQLWRPSYLLFRNMLLRPAGGKPSFPWWSRFICEGCTPTGRSNLPAIPIGVPYGGELIALGGNGRPWGAGVCWGSGIPFGGNGAVLDGVPDPCGRGVCRSRSCRRWLAGRRGP